MSTEPTQPAVILPDPPRWLDFSAERLNDSFQQVAQRISEQGRKIAEARHAHKLAKAEKEHRLGLLKVKARALLKADGDAKPSDERVEQAIYAREDLYPETCEAIGIEAAADAFLTACDGDMKALEAEKDMLIQAGSDRREEMRSLHAGINTVSSVERRANAAAEKASAQIPAGAADEPITL